MNINIQCCITRNNSKHISSNFRSIFNIINSSIYEVNTSTGNKISYIEFSFTTSYRIISDFSTIYPNGNISNTTRHNDSNNLIILKCNVHRSYNYSIITNLIRTESLGFGTGIEVITTTINNINSVITII